MTLLPDSATERIYSPPGKTLMPEPLLNVVSSEPFLFSRARPFTV